jgi:glucose-6-phosphate dehydrogenase assembly protein OpcA
LNWARLTPWRELTAELFDDPLRRPLLRHVHTLQVGYASYRPDGTDGRPRESQVAAALLYVGWLAGRLGWTLSGATWEQDEAGLSTTFRRPGALPADVSEALNAPGPAVRVVFQPRPCRSVAEVGLENVTIEASEGPDKDPVIFTLTRTSGETAAEGVCATRIREGSREIQMRTVALPYPPVATLLGDELDYQRRDALYEGSLLVARRLAGLPSATGLSG